MRLLKESNYNIDKNLESMEIVSIYPIGTEVILTTVVDDVYLYTIDNIREIDITSNGVFYYFKEAEMSVRETNIMPYSINNEQLVKKIRIWL